MSSTQTLSNEITASATGELLTVSNLYKSFPIRSGFFNKITAKVHAVDNVSISIKRGKTFALVGESGCGKTTTGRCILRLIEPDSGKISFQGQDITTLAGEDLRKIRRKMQIIFQDPFSSLNARKSVGAAITEGMKIHKLASANEQVERLAHLLEVVGLRPEYADRYPHEFSGGQRQRICIARALSVDPDFIVCDESVSALDVSIQAQIINLLEELQEERGLAYLFISHDLAVVRHIADEVGVMYLGQMLEQAPCDTLFEDPLHPYTKALLSAVPVIDPAMRNKRVILEGDVPSAANPPDGCRFHTRCRYCRQECKSGFIPVYEPTPGHKVKCVLYG